MCVHTGYSTGTAPCEFWGWNSGCQAQQRALCPLSRPSQPTFWCFTIKPCCAALVSLRVTQAANSRAGIHPGLRLLQRNSPLFSHSQLTGSVSIVGTMKKICVTVTSIRRLQYRQPPQKTTRAEPGDGSVPNARPDAVRGKQASLRSV